MVRVALRIALVMATLLCAAQAAAQARVVVLDFDGPRAARLRAQVVGALSDEGVELIAKDEAAAIAGEQGADLSTAAGRQSVARELRISAYVEGTAEKKGSRVTLTVHVYNGRDGEQLGEFDLKGNARQVRKRVQRNLWDRIGVWIDKAEAPEAEAEPEAEPESTVDEGDGDSDEERGQVGGTVDEDYDPDDAPTPSGKLHALDLGLGLRFLGRSFGYNDAVLKLADYSIGLNPALHANAHWYPAAHFSQGPAAWFGLDLAFTLLIAPDTTRDGQSYKTSAKDYRVGLRFRLPFGDHEVALAAGYAAQSFAVDDAADGTRSGLPKVAYGFLRVGPEVRLGFGAFAVEAELAYLHPLKYGNLASSGWFPNTSGMGFDAGLRVAWAPIELLEVFAGGTLRQIGLSFEPKEGDPGAQIGRVAGGAVDRYFGPELGVRLRI